MTDTARPARTRGKARPTAAQDARVRRIERRLRARLARLFPAADVKGIILDLRPLIHQAGRDGAEDHDAIWRRWQAEPLFKELVTRLTARLAEADAGQ
jgi:hypothetical protein